MTKVDKKYVEAGAILGSIKSNKKKITSRENGKKGGRPKIINCMSCAYYKYPEDRCTLPLGENKKELTVHPCLGNPCKDWVAAEKETLSKRRHRWYMAKAKKEV